MQTLHSSRFSDVTPPRSAAFPARHRLGTYLALLLLALTLIVAGRRAGGPGGPLAARTDDARPARTTSPGSASQDDRPLLVPDR